MCGRVTTPLPQPALSLRDPFNIGRLSFTDRVKIEGYIGLGGCLHETVAHTSINRDRRIEQFRRSRPATYATPRWYPIPNLTEIGQKRYSSINETQTLRKAKNQSTHLLSDNFLC